LQRLEMFNFISPCRVRRDHESCARNELSRGQQLSLSVPSPASTVGTIANVSLYRGSTLLGSANTAPYNFVVSNAPAGTNALYAVATDSLGQFSTSAVVRVFVANIGVTITSPSEDAVFLGGSTNPITIAAFTTLLSGSITNVSFFADGKLLGEDGTAPFSVLLSNAPPGSHRITAVGLSDSGNTFFATPVNFGIAAPICRTVRLEISRRRLRPRRQLDRAGLRRQFVGRRPGAARFQ
jgi:chitinase